MSVPNSLFSSAILVAFVTVVLPIGTTTAAESPYGEYVSKDAGLQIIDLGEGEFECVIYSAGLPGQAEGTAVARRIKTDAAGAEAEIAALNATPVKRVSPTLGKKPPEQAIVLFDGSQDSIETFWQPGAEKSPEGWLVAGATTKPRFQSYHLHAEFKSPFEPNDRGQQRGNSGIYHQARYETQILDSFGLEGKDNECGGIYTVRAPTVNVCFPPESWQTYDVDFEAAEYNAAGEKKQAARLTVWLNGILVHDRIPVPYATRGSKRKEGPEPGPIYFQDHGDAVRFRNIWIVEK